MIRPGTTSAWVLSASAVVTVTRSMAAMRWRSAVGASSAMRTSTTPRCRFGPTVTTCPDCDPARLSTVAATRSRALWLTVVLGRSPAARTLAASRAVPTPTTSWVPSNHAPSASTPFASSERREACLRSFVAR
ncbi:hypothetical protein [Janibacter sp. LM]|uniref:hypothetical protein n=1 Tax=Janibacter sp. LM TaxID=3144845 RepID=UPI0031F6E301